MTHQLSRRERKAMERAGGQEPAKPMISVDSKGIKRGMVYVMANVVAVAVFPFWMVYQDFMEWREARK